MKNIARFHFLFPSLLMLCYFAEYAAVPFLLCKFLFIFFKDLLSYHPATTPSSDSCSFHSLKLIVPSYVPSLVNDLAILSIGGLQALERKYFFLIIITSNIY